MFVQLIRLARPTQWVKNGIILLALIFANTVFDQSRVILSFIAIGIFCLLSSAVYTFNDLIDAESDRQHPQKKNRPIASGHVSVAQAATMIVVLVTAGLAGAWKLNIDFFVTAICFLLLNLLYTLWLKNIVILDVMTIALSFLIRAYAGAFAIDVPASSWMLSNTLLLALFLGLGKRRHELVTLEGNAASHRQSLTHYSPYLLDQLIGVVTPAVLVMYMLYSFSPEVSAERGTSYLFVTVPFVVYGLFRYLYLIHKEDKGGSPTKVLIGDKPILFTVLLWLLTACTVLYLV